MRIHHFSRWCLSSPTLVISLVSLDHPLKTSCKFKGFLIPSPTTLCHIKMPVLLRPSYTVSQKCEPPHPTCGTSFMNPLVVVHFIFNFSQFFYSIDSIFREQRLTRTLAFVMIGISILLTPILCHIPLPVLYGVFLYMGVNVLKGIQFTGKA